MPSKRTNFIKAKSLFCTCLQAGSFQVGKKKGREGGGGLKTLKKLKIKEQGAALLINNLPYCIKPSFITYTKAGQGTG